MVGAVTHIKLCAPESWQDQPFADDVYLDEFQKISESNDDFMRLFMDTFGNKNDN
jgi:hypothetical protein